jgi:hypothetical protein
MLRSTRALPSPRVHSRRAGVTVSGGSLQHAMMMQQVRCTVSPTGGVAHVAQERGQLERCRHRRLPCGVRPQHALVHRGWAQRQHAPGRVREAQRLRRGSGADVAMRRAVRAHAVILRAASQLNRASGCCSIPSPPQQHAGRNYGGTSGTAVRDSVPRMARSISRVSQMLRFWCKKRAETADLRRNVGSAYGGGGPLWSCGTRC